jgi:hypothetical protein
MKKTLLLTLSLLGMVFIASPQVNAASDFEAGRIIDDSVFTDTTRMSVADIQAFLNSKVPSCDTNGQQLSEFGGPDLNGDGKVQRWEWGKQNYNQTTFPCLKDYIQDGVSAAQLIYNASQTYSINPQVMIVLLQKEQGLVTDTWPLNVQYRSATGYGCPDTAACDSQYYGLKNQINWAATMFRAILNNSPTWYTPYVLGNNYIQYNPNASCGGSNVDIINRSTQALYNYTPYQPSQAALDAGWGTVNCGAYGNRNFYLYFTEWFGNTKGPAYAWSLTGQYAYTDNTKTTPIGLGGLKPGQRAYIGFTAVNRGSVTWTNSGSNPVRVGTTHELDRQSPFADSTWISATRPTAMKEASVAPGQTATFEFWIKAPESSRTDFKEYFDILAEGRAWMPDLGMQYGISVEPVKRTWQLTSQYAYTDDTKTVGTGLGGMEPGQRKYVGFTAKNTGNTTWTNTGPNPARIGTTHNPDRNSSFADSTWISGSRPAVMKEASVAPGETATFEFWLKAPVNQSGLFSEYFDILLEGKAWLQDIGFNYAASVVKPQYTWQLTSQYAYTDSTKTSPTGLHNLNPSQTAYVGFTAKNTGNVTWRNDGPNPVDIGTTNPYDHSSVLCGNGWLGCNRPTRMIESSVAPGQTATFEFSIKAPSTPGNYLTYFNPVVEGVTWMNSIGFNYSISVK